MKRGLIRIFMKIELLVPSCRARYDDHFDTHDAIFWRLVAKKLAFVSKESANQKFQKQSSIFSLIIAKQ